MSCRLRLSAVVVASVLAACSPPSEAAGPDARLVETLRFPDHSDAPLTAVQAMAARADGEVFVLDRRTPAVLWFDADGRFRRMLGRQGEGPGEFQWPFYIGVVGDTLWAIDERLDRVTFFDGEGKLLETRAPMERVRLPEGLRSASPLAYLRDGSLLLAASRDASFQQLVLLKLRPTETEPIELAPLDATQRWWVVEVPSGGSSSGQHQPFGFHDLFAFWTQGSAVVLVERPEPEDGRRGSFFVRTIASAGDSVAATRVDYTPGPLTASDVDAVLEHWLQGAVGESFLRSGLFPSAESLRRAGEEGLVLPAYGPPITNDGLGIVDRSVLVSAEGAVWVRRWTRPVEPQRWDVIGPHGVERAVQVPAGVVLHAVRGDTAWGIVHDELDVPTIVRYGMEPMGG